MAKCNTCGQFVSAKAGKDGATCCKCTKDNTSRNKNKIMPKELNIRTPIVSAEMRSPLVGCVDALDTSEEEKRHQGTTPKLDVGEEIRLFRAELRDMKSDLFRELKDLRREIGDLRQTIVNCETRMDTLESRMKELEGHQGNVENLEKTVSWLKMEINERDQELLSSDLEISNLPEERGENTIHVVEVVAKKLGVPLESRDIVFAERIGPVIKQRESADTSHTSGTSEPGSASRPRRMVVRLTRRQLRDQLLHSARVRRGATSADLGMTSPARRFFLNERLSKYNSRLFFQVRRAATKAGWKYAWTKRGKILVKQADGKQTYGIRTDVDLQRVFGPDTFREATV